jgi:hypothetical protein
MNRTLAFVVLFQGHRESWQSALLSIDLCSPFYNEILDINKSSFLINLLLQLKGFLEIVALREVIISGVADLEDEEISPSTGKSF